MPISGTSTDYSTRKKDIHILQGVNPNQLSRITPSFGRISNYCAGVQKLIQRYAIALLTELGSQTKYPDFGSTLLRTLNNRNFKNNKADVFHIFNFANAAVVTSFRAYQAKTKNLPDDEQLATAQLKDVVVSNDSVSLSIQLYTVDTNAVVFLLPIPTNK
jgi:hypothetical protein